MVALEDERECVSVRREQEARGKKLGPVWTNTAKWAGEARLLRDKCGIPALAAC